MKVVAIKVHQPLGEFFIAKIRANELLNISYSEEYKYLANGKQEGSQRPIDVRRLKEIANFIKSEEMCFPTSILIALNYGFSSDNVEIENIVKVHNIDGDVYELTIPDDQKVAMIIDGQHRLNAFKYVDGECQNIELVCSIFFDLPNPYQAYLFATINGNQKKVNKSLALEFFGYNVEDEPSEEWTPEKLAVYLTRKLNFMQDSPLYHRLKLAASYDDNENENKLASTAAIVEGILSLISNNPKRDRDIISAKRNGLFSKRSRNLVSLQKDNSPIRHLYLDNEDNTIYTILIRFFFDVKNILWEKAKEESVIQKTVGILALFDLLKAILIEAREENIAYESLDYSKYLRPSQLVDFSDNYFSTSGLGKGRVKRVLKFLSGISKYETLKDDDKVFLQTSELI